jgi:hypothetical protein
MGDLRVRSPHDDPLRSERKAEIEARALTRLAWIARTLAISILVIDWNILAQCRLSKRRCDFA